MTAALRYIPLEWRFVLLACAAAVLVLAAGVYTGLQIHAPTITRTRQVVHAPASGSALAAAWGTPDQSVAGATDQPFAERPDVRRVAGPESGPLYRAVTVHFTFSVTRRSKADARHEQTVAEYAARIRALEAELEQTKANADDRDWSYAPVVDLAAEREKRGPLNPTKRKPA